MKYCRNCGTKIPDDSTNCPSCGEKSFDQIIEARGPVSEPSEVKSQGGSKKNKVLGIIAQIMMYSTILVNFIIGAFALFLLELGRGIIGAITGSGHQLLLPDFHSFTSMVYFFVMVYCLVSFIWILPMSISLSVKCAKKKNVSVAFGVFTLLLVNLIPGILILAMDRKGKNQEN